MFVCSTYFQYNTGLGRIASFPLTVFYHLPYGSDGEPAIDLVVPLTKLTRHERHLLQSEEPYLEAITMRGTKRDIRRRQAYARSVPRELSLVA